MYELQLMNELSDPSYPTPPYKDPLDKRIVSIIRKNNKAQEGSLNIVGIPFDGATLGRRGSRLAPNYIRDSLRFDSNFNVETGDLLLEVKMNDLGDMVFSDEEIDSIHGDIQRLVSLNIKERSLLILLGGDNSISLPAILACANRYTNVGLIVIDSHFDLRGKIRNRPTSGSSYGLAIEALGSRISNRVVELGIHGFVNSYKYMRKAQRIGVTFFTAEDVRKYGATTSARRAYQIAAEGADCVYLSLDLDSVDISQVSGVSAPSPGGLCAQDVFDIIYFIASRPKVKCADIVETSPPLDPTGKTPVVAATSLLYMAAGFGLRGFLSR
jgi:formiminoglutamase